MDLTIQAFISFKPMKRVWLLFLIYSHITNIINIIVTSNTLLICNYNKMLQIQNKNKTHKNTCIFSGNILCAIASTYNIALVIMPIPMHKCKYMNIKYLIFIIFVA